MAVASTMPTDSTIPTDPTSDIGSAYSDILPSLNQLMQKYEIEEDLEIRLVNLPRNPSSEISPSGISSSEISCCFHDGHIVFGLKNCDNKSALCLSPDKAQQFLEEIGSQISAIMPRIDRAVEEGGKQEAPSEIHFPLKAEGLEQLKPCCRIGSYYYCTKPPCPNLGMVG